MSAQQTGLDQLAVCRREIDEIDLRILAMLNERTRIVERIGQVKQECGFAIYEPKREEQVFANVLAHNSGPLPADAVKRLFERIIDEMRMLQKLRQEQAQIASVERKAPE